MSPMRMWSPQCDGVRARRVGMRSRACPSYGSSVPAPVPRSLDRRSSFPRVFFQSLFRTSIQGVMRHASMYHPDRMRGLTARQAPVAMLSIVLVTFGVGKPLAADTYPRQPGIDARHYVIRLTLLTSESNEIQAEATVTLRVVAPGTRDAILDLTSTTPDGKGMTVTAVTSGGRAVP